MNNKTHLRVSKVKQWDKERTKLKKIYQQKGITTCEVKLKGCMIVFGLSFAHRHKRIYYYDKPELLGDFNESILACAFCHQQIETDKKLTKEIFNKLRK